jgi:hypothetical protein
VRGEDTEGFGENVSTGTGVGPPPVGTGSNSDAAAGATLEVDTSSRIFAGGSDSFLRSAFSGKGSFSLSDTN